MIELGSTDINKLYLGSTEVNKAYLGSTLVFDNSAPAMAYYEFTNDAKDTIGGYDGTLNNISFGYGKVGYAAVFNGSTSNVVIPHNASFNFGNGTTDTPFSIEISFNADVDEDFFLISKRNSPADKEWQLDYNAGSVRFILFDQANGGTLNVGFTPTFSAGTWYHLLVTYDGSGTAGGIKIYWQGSSQSLSDSSAGTYVALNALSEDIYIGDTAYASTRQLDGKVDEVAIYPLELSSSDVSTRYNDWNNGNPIKRYDVRWGGALTGNYTALPGVATTDTVTAVGAGNQAFNHIPHVIEYYGDLHIIYATANTDEEEPGQYARYQKSTDGGSTWSTPVTILESQDDITNGWTTGGRVVIPSCFAVVSGVLYGVFDINDRGASGGARTGVGVLAVSIDNSANFGTPVWIENVDGTTNVPTAVPTFPSYSFDSSLRTSIRNYLLSDPQYKPGWYFSVQSSDDLYSRYTEGLKDLSEPSFYTAGNGLEVGLWRYLLSGGGVAARSKISVVNNSARNTSVPDWPSRTRVLRVSENYFVMVGNNDNTDRSPLFVAFSIDGYNWDADNIYNLDTETTGPTYSGQFKETGVQYPDLIQKSNGDIVCVYSVNKEDMRVAVFSPPTIN